MQKRASGARLLRDFLNFTVADAGRAGANALVSAIDDRANRLQIDVPAAIGHVVRVTHLVSELRTLAAQITNSGHNLLILSKQCS